jgi:hypothetical protein
MQNKIGSDDEAQKRKAGLGIVAHAYNLNFLGGGGMRPALGKNSTVSKKYQKQKMAGSMAQVVQHLSSKTEALTLISST